VVSLTDGSFMKYMRYEYIYLKLTRKYIIALNIQEKTLYKPYQNIYKLANSYQIKY